MPHVKPRHLVQNIEHSVADILTDIDAARRSGQIDDYHQQLDAYTKETEALRAAGRPLSERKLQPPQNSPYQATPLSAATSGLKLVGSALNLVTAVALIFVGGFSLIVIVGLTN